MQFQQILLASWKLISPIQHLKTNSGYTAPEYAIHGQLTEKVDVYSFGLVVLEIMSGRRTNSLRMEPVTEYLLEWVSICIHCFSS